MAVGRVQSVSGTAAATDTVTSGTLTTLVGGPSTLLMAMCAHGGAGLDTPLLSVTYGGADSFSMLAAQSNLNISIEIWVLTNPTTTSGTIVGDFGTGATVSSILYVAEIPGFGSLGPTGAPAGNTGFTSPVTQDFVSGALDGGRAGTTTIPADNSLIMAMGCMFTSVSGSTLTVTSGTSDLNTTAGTLFNTISAFVAFSQATGGTDTISATESVNREWCSIAVDVLGPAPDGMAIISPARVASTTY